MVASDTVERRAGTFESVVSAARTSVGDGLRSVVHFTPGDLDVLYVRDDLQGPDEGGAASRARLVEFERVGFAEAPVRTALSGDVGQSGIGPYAFTVRFHEDGFVVRVIEGDAGVLLTADGMNANAFREAATAIRQLLGAQAG